MTVKMLLLLVIAGPSLLTAGFVVGGGASLGVLHALHGVVPNVEQYTSVALATGVFGAVALPYWLLS